MAKYKCKMCGAPLDVKEGQTVVTCQFCQSTQTVANADDERKENLFNRANTLRASCDFDKAILSYQSILSVFPNEPEAHWGLCLCKYGIEYVDDPATKKKIPTIHRVSYDSILKDSDYLAALSYADPIAKEEYQTEAKQIADIQNNFLSISQKEEPFDIFICYKETDANGKRTQDSVLAQEIYSNLTDKGYKVFFSRITLESKLGSRYEPYIFAALNSAKIRLVVGSKKEYFEAVWVKNEWSRFIDLMKTRPDHYLIPCYRNMEAYEMPEQFLAFQGQDRSKLGFRQDLLRGIDKIMGRNEVNKAVLQPQIIQTDVNVSALAKRAEILIGDGDYDKADELLEKVLDNDPVNSQAYLLKLLIEKKFHTIEDLKTLDNTLEKNSNFKKAYDFGDEEQKKRLSSINEFISNRNEEKRLDNLYNRALEYKNQKKYTDAESVFSSISGYRDAAKQVLECTNLGKEEIYNKALSLKEQNYFSAAIETFTKIKDFKDSETQISECTELFNNAKYVKASKLKESGKFDEAASIFKELGSYQDSEFQTKECFRLKEDAEKEAVYVTCVLDREINPRLDFNFLTAACQNLTKIPGYKNSDELLAKYEGIIADYKKQLAKEAEEAARKKKLRAKKAKKVSFYTILSSVLVTGILLLTFLFLIPSGRQSNIRKLIDSKQYDEASALLEKNGGFGDSSNLMARCHAGEAFDNLDYETGIDYLYTIGGTVDVSYDNNGGTSKNSSEQIKKGKRFISNDATKSGYEFHGWVLTDYNIISKNHTASIKLKAQYEIINYSILFDLNGGESSEELPSSYNTEESITIPNPTRTGYTFVGWTGYDLTDPVTDYTLPKGSTGNKIYTANWKANTYIIHLDARGGKVSQPEIKVTYSRSYVLPTPTYDGYEFIGWYDKFTNKKYTGGKYFIPSDLYLVAFWNVHKYTIDYNLDGGINNPSNPSTYTVESPNFTISEPSKTGYTFLGWTSNVIATPRREVTIKHGSTGNLSFTANWKANTYNVTIDLNGGTADKTSYIVTFDSKYEFDLPVRVGYTFDKFTYNNGVLDFTGTWTIPNDVVLKANWIANGDTEYIVNHYLEDLDGKGYTKVDTETCQGVSDSNTLVKAKKYEGFTAQTEAQTVKIAADGTTVANFYYTRNYYTISFVTNGGNEIESQHYKYEETIPSTLQPTREHYTFDGWYMDEGQTTLFDKMPAKNQTVYAYYSEETKASLFDYASYENSVTITKCKTDSGTVVIPAYIGGKLVTSVGDNAFKDCSSLTSVTLPTAITSIGDNAFENCSSLLQTPDLTNITSYGSNAFKNCSLLTDLRSIDGIATFGEGVFSSCENISKIAITFKQNLEAFYVSSFFKGTSDPEKYYGASDKRGSTCYVPLALKEIEFTATAKVPDYFLYGLTSVTKVVDKSTSSASIGNHSFDGCTALTDYSVENNFISSVGEYAFHNCSSLKTLPAFNLTEIKNHAFDGCRSLEGSLDFSGATSIGDSAFENCASITEITLSDSVNELGSSAFKNCVNLVSVYGAPNLSIIKDRTFEGCVLLQQIPDLSNAISIGSYAFYDCCSLLITPDLTNIASVGDYAFVSCNHLSEVGPLNGCAAFGVGVFDGCENLSKINLTFKGEIEEFYLQSLFYGDA